MDFMHDQLQDGRRIRVLTVVDRYTREALATEARGSFSAHNVIDVLNRLSRSHRKPAVIQVDNGTEFASRALAAWAYREDVRLGFSRPESPTANAHIESFIARLRARCLNAHVFESLDDAEETLTSWRSDYNAPRPFSALGMLTPKEFAELDQRNAGRRWPELLVARVASKRGEDHTSVPRHSRRPRELDRTIMRVFGSCARPTLSPRLKFDTSGTTELRNSFGGNLYPLRTRYRNIICVRQPCGSIRDRQS
jgi:putative transposase